MDTILILERLDRLEKLQLGHKEVLTFDEACDYTGISRSYLYKLTASGRIPHSKPTGKCSSLRKQNSLNGYSKTNESQNTISKRKLWHIRYVIKYNRTIFI